MYGDFYLMKYMGRKTDTFGRSKFFAATELTILCQNCAANRANNIQLLMLVLGFMVNSRQKYLIMAFL